MSLQPGSRLGRYEIVAPLGAGGMGEVYRGRDTSLDRDVAIKVLPIGTTGIPDARERLSREARALSRLSHPHICAVHDVGDDAGSLFVVMELLEGETLAARLVRGPLGLAETRRVGGEIAEALGAAHRQGIVHRDLASGVDEPVVLNGMQMQMGADTSADGTWLLYGERAERGTYDIHALQLTGGPPVPIATTAFNEVHPALCADGQFVAFTSDDTGRPEVYVTPLTAPGSKRRVSVTGGSQPRWDRASRALVYLAPDNRVMSVPYGPGAAPEFGTPAPLFTLPREVTWSAYDIAPDGRFLAIVPVQYASRQPLTVLVNWPSTLPR